MNFISIDVETANADMASICQIGIAKYSNNELIEEWVTLVNPNDYFADINIDIHGINKVDVEHSPTFPEVSEILINFFKDTVIVSHTHFDRISIGRAFGAHNLQMPETTWLDSAKVARRAWPEFSKKGYGLKNIARHIGYEFNHHDALEDAKAAGEIMLHAMKISNLDISGWQKRVAKPVIQKSIRKADLHKEGNPEGKLYGEVVVFTGALAMPRKEAVDLASNIGCTVAPGVTNKTTLLVVGDQDISTLSEKAKSSKHLKAEAFISKGHRIRIITESDFKELIVFATKTVQ